MQQVKDSRIQVIEFMIQVCFIQPGKAYLPEVYAYSNFLNQKNISNVIVSSDQEAKDIKAKVYYRFGGFLHNRILVGSVEIHEYHTVSTGRFIKLKNIIKSLLSAKPDYLSFLNKFVDSNYFFPNSIPRLYRDMGADENLLTARKSASKKEFDICYFGSLSNRKGVVDSILKLSQTGYTFVVGGNAVQSDVELLRDCQNITYLGICDRDTVYKHIEKSRFGLNIIPDEFPLTHQTSTKVIEYLVAGLPIISNSYKWINEHSLKYGYQYVELSNTLILPENLINLVIPDNVAEQFTWNYILEKSRFYDVIQKLVNR